MFLDSSLVVWRLFRRFLPPWLRLFSRRVLYPLVRSNKIGTISRHGHGADGRRRRLNDLMS